MKKLILITFLSFLLTNFVNAQNPTYVKRKLVVNGKLLIINDSFLIAKRYDKNLIFAWAGNYQGTSLLNEVGENPTYVSGTGVNAIYDFEPLNDIRFNKNAYLGNSYSLPAYWDYPFDSIYADTANSYHWKLQDFHYRFVENQIYDNDLSNCFFGKFTYSSGTLTEISEIYVFNQTATNFDAMRTWIGILPDYYSINLVNGDFTGDSTLTVPTDWETLGWKTSIQNNGWQILDNQAKYLGTYNGTGVPGGTIRPSVSLPIGYYRFDYDVISRSGVVDFRIFVNNTYVVITSNLGSQNYEWINTVSNSQFLIRGITLSRTMTVDNLQLRRFYQNYYSGEGTL